jgi:uncharacterized protein (TIGR00369 family)
MDHFRKLERMYLGAPINQLYRPTIAIGEGTAEIGMAVDPRFYHAAHALHGSVYFKLLDDAAFFAANSLEREVFVLTASFQVQLFRPIAGDGTIRAVGRVVRPGKQLIFAEAVLYDGDKEAARGSGVFARGQTPLGPEVGYAQAPS